MLDSTPMRHLRAVRDRLVSFEQAHPEFNTGEVAIVESVDLTELA